MSLITLEGSSTETDLSIIKSNKDLRYADTALTVRSSAFGSDTRY